MQEEKVEKAKQTKPVNWLLASWTNCLEQLQITCDAAFFGDSLTYLGRWYEYFPSIRCVNLGFPGDYLGGMMDRVPQIAAVSPKYVFVMGGINGFQQIGQEETFMHQKELLFEIQKAVPNSRIIAADILPIRPAEGNALEINREIAACNEKLRAFTAENGFGHLCLWDFYQKDGILREEFTTDGTHLRPETYRFWAAAAGEYLGLTSTL